MAGPIRILFPEIVPEPPPPQYAIRNDEFYLIDCRTYPLVVTTLIFIVLVYYCKSTIVELQ